jgi:hypothetical protein
MSDVYLVELLMGYEYVAHSVAIFHSEVYSWLYEQFGPHSNEMTRAGIKTFKAFEMRPKFENNFGRWTGFRRNFYFKNFDDAVLLKLQFPYFEIDSLEKRVDFELSRTIERLASYESECQNMIKLNSRMNIAVQRQFGKNPIFCELHTEEKTFPAMEGDKIVMRCNKCGWWEEDINNG